MKKELEEASDKWIEWFNSEDEDEPEPEIKISFKGKLAEQYSDADYDKYYEEAIDDLTNIGIEKNEYGALRIIDGEITPVVMAFCFGGFGVFILIVVLFLVAWLSMRKKSNIVEY